MPSDETFTAKLNVDDRDYTKKMATAGLTAFQLGGMAVAGAAVAATAYVALTRRVSLLGAEVVQSGYKIGASVQDMQTLKMAADLTGAPLAGMGSSYRKLNELWAANAKYGGTLRQTVQGLGVNFDNLAKKTPVERFNALLIALATIQDPLERLQATRAIFQGEAEGVYPLVERKPEELGKLLDEAGRPEMQITQGQADAADKAKGGWEKIKAAAIAGAADDPVMMRGMRMANKVGGLPGVTRAVSAGAAQALTGPQLVDLVGKIYLQLDSLTK